VQISSILRAPSGEANQLQREAGKNESVLIRNTNSRLEIYVQKDSGRQISRVSRDNEYNTIVSRPTAP